MRLSWNPAPATVGSLLAARCHHASVTLLDLCGSVRGGSLLHTGVVLAMLHVESVSRVQAGEAWDTLGTQRPGPVS